VSTQYPIQQINESALDDGLAQVEAIRTWSPRTIAKLENRIRTGEDFSLFRVNPVEFARETGIPEPEAVDLFLHSVQADLFRMDWHLLCPSCGDIVQSFDSLTKMSGQLHCQFCSVDMKASLDDYVEVGFTISPGIRGIAPHDPDSLEVEDYFFRYHFCETGQLPDGGPPFLDVLKSKCRFVDYLDGGEERSVEVDLEEGLLVIHDMRHTVGIYQPVELSGSATDATIQISEEGVHIEPSSLRPGPAHFILKNGFSDRSAIFLIQLPPGYENATLEFPPFLSGNNLLNSQTFRDLFRGETVGQKEALGIRDLTILFTDLKASTELYERIGDLEAFALVQHHFEYLSKAIKENQGAIVKTIGDAVMATFETPGDGVSAAYAMLDEIDTFNRAQGAEDIALKIGLHRGASIAVNLNDQLDYFGQTVNVAARVQDLAGPNEIYLTEDVYSDATVQELSKGHEVTEQDAHLKGVQKSFKVFCCR